MRRAVMLGLVDLSFLMSGLMFAASLISLSSLASADPNTLPLPYCGTPAAGSVTCPNAPAYVSGECVLGARACYCQ
jgi:hypothetical protein